MRKVLLGIFLVIMLATLPSMSLAESDIIWEDTGGSKTLETGYGVYAETHFWGMYAGWSGTAPLVIVNGRDKDREFLITIETPGKLESGFEALPEECFSWITISSNLVTASAGETIQVPVTITIPADIVYTNEHQQVAIQVREAGQGLIQLALQSKWFISTDPYIPVVGGVNKTLVIVIAAAIAGVGGTVYLIMRRKMKYAKK